MNVNPWGPNSANPPATQVNECILGPDGKLKLEEHKCHQENNLCMMCGKPGHAMSACPTAMRGRVVKMGRKPREGILHSLPCLVLRVRAMSQAQSKGTNSLCSRCTMVCDRTGLALWLWQPHK